MKINNKPFNGEKTTCVIVCGGEGRRFLPLSIDRQKGMIEVDGKPILRHIVDYWKQYTEDFIFIVNYRKEGIIEYFSRQPDINVRFVEEQDIKGIANALKYVKDHVSENFIVVLGDCICSGEFYFPDNMGMAIGVWKTDNEDHILQSYSVETQGDVVNGVVEKPKVLINDLCGTGFYFFRKPFFGHIDMTPPSPRTGKIEITEVIQTMIDNGERIMAATLEGDYINMTEMRDLEIASRILQNSDAGKTARR